MRARRRGCEFCLGVLGPVLALGACVPVEDAADITGPEDPSDLTVVADTDTPEVFEGMTVTLSAEATGGTAPYLYRWDQNDGPVELDLADAMSDVLTTEALAAPGRYVFRVVATDSGGFHATGFATVEVIRTVTASAPELAVVGEPAELSAELTAEAAGATLTWEIARGTASLEDETSSNPTLTTAAGETVEVLLTVTLSSTDTQPVTTTRSFEIVSVFDLHPQVLMETSVGDITMELDGELAPLHTVNFLLYVDDGFYDGLLFHRNVCSDDPETDECQPFVIQGGGYRRVDGELELIEATRDPVPSEADNGLSNDALYSISLALISGQSASGTTEFFINLADNGFLDEQGFTVFGMVVAGTDVVDAIAAADRTDSPIIPGEVSLPVEDVIMQRVSRVSP